MNKTILTGRLTKDPTVFGENEKKVVKFTLAVEKPVKKDAERQADFVPIAAFGKLADIVESHLKKGAKIAVEARIHTGDYEKEGKKVYTIEVVAERIEFLDSKSKKANEGIENTDGITFYEDLPF